MWESDTVVCEDDSVVLLGSHCDSLCSGKPYGADDFLPVLMYVLARSNLTEVLLNVEYMMELMDPALQLGEGKSIVLADGVCILEIIICLTTVFVKVGLWLDFVDNALANLFKSEDLKFLPNTLTAFSSAVP